MCPERNDEILEGSGLLGQVFSALLIALGLASAPGAAAGSRYGLTYRPGAAYLGLPRNDRGAVPTVLSETGTFRDVRTLSPATALIPYGLNVPFWSDGAEKRRWIAIPSGRSSKGATIRFAPKGQWTFREGTVFVKHFELAVDENQPDLKRRLETRLLVRTDTGDVYGVSYKWRPDNSDADLVREGRLETIEVKTASGRRAGRWYYPGPTDCRQCHTLAAGGVLGVNTRQLNGDFTYPSGVVDNQLRAWNHLGLFEPAQSEADIQKLDHLAQLDAPGRSLEDRARSYLDANCAYCHRPGGAAADFDARYDTPLAEQRLLGATVRIDLGVDGVRAVAPNDPWRSAILTRIQISGSTGMPPLGHEVIDRRGVELLRAWITSLPGPPVVDPPSIEPKSGDFRGTIRVHLAHPDPHAVIRYTLDGTAPGKSSSVYTGPFPIARSTTVRARAYKPGFTRSITVQETLIIED
jgi:uncharacterized repeat protein (TIGR03806 family)